MKNFAGSCSPSNVADAVKASTEVTAKSLPAD